MRNPLEVIKNRLLGSGDPFKGTAPAPEFPPDLEWLNTGRPLTLRELRGKVVLLDFWTYCCINCMHVIPDLKKLEAKYSGELVVIGVHSGKFTTEKESDGIAAAVRRYEIEHPVVNDRDFAIWKAYQIKGWPSFALIDPQGRLVGNHSGEGVYNLFNLYMGQMIDAFERKGKLDRRPLELDVEEGREAATAESNGASPLLFPGKLATAEDGLRLFVSDSNHHRILAVDVPGGAVREIVGSGKAGLRDGDFAAAEFNRPQGVAAAGDSLWVADTENHAIRRVDFSNRRVTTVAGTGVQARRFNVAGKGEETALNSPWDLLQENGVLYIAMAGSHQLWRLDVESLTAEPYAGSGKEDRVDGPLDEASLAQPSGITTDGSCLYFADSEASAVRSADLDPAGRVVTLVGEGLFEFGDQDGTGWGVRLQHPLGILFHEGLLYVADTYNNKIKTLDPQSRRATTLVGTGKPGRRDGAAAEAELNEPGGLAVAGRTLYIADANNHCIRMLDLDALTVTTLPIELPPS